MTLKVSIIDIEAPRPNAKSCCLITIHRYYNMFANDVLIV